MSRELHRSAVTGRLVTAEFAAANPDTTVSEQVDDGAHHAAVLDAVHERLTEIRDLLAGLET